jgi:hypothetical protein
MCRSASNMNDRSPIFLTSSGTTSMAVDGDKLRVIKAAISLAFLMPLHAFAVFCTEKARWLTTIYARAHSFLVIFGIIAIETIAFMIHPRDFITEYVDPAIALWTALAAGGEISPQPHRPCLSGA